MRTALLIIDMQRSLIEDETWDAERLLDRVTALEGAARDSGVPVVYVADNRVGPHGELDRRLTPQPGDLHVEKGVPDAFEGTVLRAALDGHGVERLVVCGLQTDCCIDATVRGAAALGYRVVLAGDAHSTFDREEATAAEVIAERNRTLAGVAEVVAAGAVKFV
jgi:nicotinamidase-related amidase